MRRQTVLFGKCRRIPQQVRSLCSSFVLSFPLIVPTQIQHVQIFVSGIQEHTHTKLCAFPVRNDLGAKKYAKFEGGESAKKKYFFWSKLSKIQKFHENAFWPNFFSNFCLRRTNFGQHRVLLLLGGARKTNLFNLKTRSTKFLNFLLKSTPLDKILDPPLFWLRFVLLGSKIDGIADHG